MVPTENENASENEEGSQSRTEHQKDELIRPLSRMTGVRPSYWGYNTKEKHKTNTVSELVELARRHEMRPPFKLTLIWSHGGCWMRDPYVLGDPVSEKLAVE